MGLNKQYRDKRKALQPEKVAEEKLRCHLRAAYGITLEQYRAMAILQQNRCAICNRLPKQNRLDVDHDHTTGKIRKLLCRPCNQMLGFSSDNAQILITAAAYLDSFK
jgi:hypothetical protein